MHIKIIYIFYEEMILACSIYICTHKIHVHLYDKVCQMINSNLQPSGF